MFTAAMETIVIGHRNPDMDSICSAVAYAELKRRNGETGVRAARCGPLNERITYVLAKFGVPQPDFVPDVTPRVRDAMVTSFVSVTPDQPVFEALELMQSHRFRALPVVEKDGTFRGVITGHRLLGQILPPQSAANRAREVRASLRNIARTFDGRLLTGEASGEDGPYALVVVAMDLETFRGRLAALDPRRTVLFVGDREDVQWLAVESGVRGIVVTGGGEVDAALVSAAADRGVCLISSAWDTATTVFFTRGAIEVRHVIEPCAVTLDAETTLTTAKRSALPSNQLIFPVLENGRLEGVLSKSDFLQVRPRQLVLVDHNELSQAVPGAADVPIVEILDHHRLGSLATEQPILFINRPVGSTCTLVADLYERQGVQPSAAVAGLLMAGIISDTLNGQSPTATDLDRRFLAELAERAGVSADELAAGIFSVGSPLHSLPPDEIISADAKLYEEDGRRFSVAQIEEVTFAGFDERQRQLREALAKRVTAEGLLFAALLVTDIKTQNSYLLAEGDDDFLSRIHYPEQFPKVWFLHGVVSRKKQLLPYLTECLGKGL